MKKLPPQFDGVTYLYAHDELALGELRDCTQQEPIVGVYHGDTLEFVAMSAGVYQGIRLLLRAHGVSLEDILNAEVPVMREPGGEARYPARDVHGRDDDD